ncbi:Hypothetical_protein [Hexamita inflata]|uniref:Hypothetical_protein n=1 Tax=Hexamita inflata TaxID=28002 RepID=A0AA86U146_9EUKA|nr:Hypothetical protein HINF_LOCUS23924 [Hexamita inflata]
MLLIIYNFEIQTTLDIKIVKQNYLLILFIPLTQLSFILVRSSVQELQVNANGHQFQTHLCTLGAPPQPRQPTTRVQASRGRNAAASCKPIYTGIHLRRTICVSKEAMELLPLYNPEGSLIAAQHFEPGDFTFRNRFEERESIINHTKQSWYSSNATSALTLAVELNRSSFTYIKQQYEQKAKPKATLDRTGSEQPSRIEDLEHERVRKYNNKHDYRDYLQRLRLFSTGTLYSLQHVLYQEWKHKSSYSFIGGYITTYQKYNLLSLTLTNRLLQYFYCRQIRLQVADILVLDIYLIQY